jgi:glycolate oxidase
METTTAPLLTTQHIEAFKKIVGDRFVLLDEESLHHYSHDETEDLHYLPDVVIKPKTAEEISAILKICNKEK